MFVRALRGQRGSGAEMGDPALVAREFTPAGRGLRPFPPVHPRARRIAASGDVEITWLRRSRTFAADSWERPEVPLAEEHEEYELDILEDGSVVRSVSALTTPAFTYSAAMQAADFGGPVTTLALRIAQLGALGRGAPLAATIPITEVE